MADIPSAQPDTHQAAMVANHTWIAARAARRFANKGVDLDDLFQVGCVGLVNAAARFDPNRGARFATFATPTVVGEIRRHFRDRGWALRVSRGLKERDLTVRATRERLTHALGRDPQIHELAEAMGDSIEDVMAAIGAGASYRASSLDGHLPSDEPMRLAASLAVVDTDVDATPDRLDVREAILQLQPRARTAVMLRFYRGMTQAEIAKELGISQVHVSRTLRSALDELGDALTGPATNGGAGRRPAPSPDR